MKWQDRKPYIEGMLRDYPYMDQYITKRESELLFPYNENADKNIGGGRALFKKNEGVALAAITIAEDNRIKRLKEQRTAIEYCLSCSDDLTKSIIDELYFQKRPKLTLEGLAVKYNISRSVVSRRRIAFFDCLTERLGL